MRGLGAGRFISSADTAFQDERPGLDAVIDTVGGAVLDASYPLMRPGGRLVTLGAPPSPERAKELSVHAMFFVVTPDPAALVRLASLVDDGKLRTIVSQTFPLSRTPIAARVILPGSGTGFAAPGVTLPPRDGP